VFAKAAKLKTLIGLSAFPERSNTVMIYTKTGDATPMALHRTKLYRPKVGQGGILRLTDSTGKEVPKIARATKEFEAVPTREIRSGRNSDKFLEIIHFGGIESQVGMIDLSRYFMISKGGAYNFTLALFLYRNFHG